MIVLAVLNGAGRHIEFVTPAELSGLMRVRYVEVHIAKCTPEI
jgi:hypothetical protein